MAKIGMTIICKKGEIIFYSIGIGSENNASRHKAEIFIKGLCEKSFCIWGNWGAFDPHYFLVCHPSRVFMSAVPFTHCIHTCQERINNPRKFISLNRQREWTSERMDFSVTMQIKENFHSSLYFRSVILIHSSGWRFLSPHLLLISCRGWV